MKGWIAIAVVAAVLALGAQPATARRGCQNIAQAMTTAQKPGRADPARRPGAGGDCEETPSDNGASTAARAADGPSKPTKPSSGKPRK